MPDKGIKPPNKRVDELVTEITAEMWETFETSEQSIARNDKMTTFLIRQVAYNRFLNETLEEKINEILNK